MTLLVKMYAVVTREGVLKAPKNGAPSLYRNLARARAFATDDGDSVVEVHIDLAREPLFIREVPDADT